MSRAKLFNFEIDAGGRECDRFEPRFASYDTVTSEGDTLEELLENAGVSIVDQDGGELSCDSTDEEWALDLIRAKFESLGPGAAHEAQLEAEGDRQLEDAKDQGDA